MLAELSIALRNSDSAPLPAPQTAKGSTPNLKASIDAAHVAGHARTLSYKWTSHEHTVGRMDSHGMMNTSFSGSVYRAGQCCSFASKYEKWQSVNWEDELTWKNPNLISILTQTLRGTVMRRQHAPHPPPTPTPLHPQTVTGCTLWQAAQAKQHIKSVPFSFHNGSILMVFKSKINNKDWWLNKDRNYILLFF